MMKLSGFADEISPDLTQQLTVLKEEKMKYIELRSVWGKNITDLSDEELHNAKKELEQNNIQVSAIGSRVGKIGILDEFETHLFDLDRAISIAKLFGTEYIRVFSFLIPSTDDSNIHRDEVLLRMKRMINKAEEAEVTLLLENEFGTYADVPQRCLDVLETCSSPKLRLAFDPANFVQAGVKPMSEGFDMLMPYVEYIHMKDARFANRKVTPVGMGDGEIAELVRRLQEAKYDGFLSLEPHLRRTGQYPDLSHPELFILACHSLKEMLKAVGEEWA
jgi:sugar phosphate isomerase/epimerase